LNVNVVEGQTTEPSGSGGRGRPEGRSTFDVSPPSCPTQARTTIMLTFARRVVRPLIRRLLVAGVTLLGITMVTFFCIRALPGEVGEGLGEVAAGRLDAQEIERRRRLCDLDRPLSAQYLAWLGRSIRLDFDRSWITHRPVGEMIRDAVPRSLQVMIPAILLWYLVGVPLGVFLALRRRAVSARFLVTGLFAVYSLPGFFMGTLLIVLLANPDNLAWFPAGGLSGDSAPIYSGLTWLVSTGDGWRWLGDRALHLVLPVACMVYASAAYLAEQTRVSTLEGLAQPWVRSARMKGLSEFAVVTRHVLRNALIPIITLAALALPAAFTGSVFLEKIFSIEGVGWLLVRAVEEHDHPVVMAVTTIAAALTLLGMLVSDLLYSIADPRIRFQ